MQWRYPSQEECQERGGNAGVHGSGGLPPEIQSTKVS
jgi:hypothetical protein